MPISPSTLSAVSGALARVLQGPKAVSFIETPRHAGAACSMGAGPDESAIASVINFWEFGRTEWVENLRFRPD